MKKPKDKKRWIPFVLFSLLTGCFSETTLNAPVTDGTIIEAMPRSGTYRVMPGDTLYSIAWQYGLDYRVLARENRLHSPYSVHTNQIIYLRKSFTQKPMSVEQQQISEPTLMVSNWRWPAKGVLIGKFSSLNKGINIAGKLGDPIYAATSGKVVYSGNGLRGYGNLIIIKHNSAYLTAYAHNQSNDVKAGEKVMSGQKIAKMGKSDSQQVMLHFEIRRNGKPENPLVYLSR